MAVQSTLTPRGYTPGNVAQAQDAAVFERSGAGVYLTMEWITAYIQTTLGNGSAISFGTTNPANTVGEQDDVFFNIGTGEVLSKGASTWAVQANFALDTEVTAAIAAAITAHSGTTDPHPIYLTQAEATALYKPLTTDDSVATGLRFALKTTITGTPASGEVQFNNATLSSVTQLLISETGRDGSSIPTLLDMLQQTTRIIIQVEQSEGLYAWFNITGAPTDSGTYRTVPVSFVTAPTGVTTVAGLGTAAAELTLDFYGVGGSSAVSSGIKFQYNTSTTLPASSKQFRANTATPETATSLSFSVTEDQSNSPSVASVLSRLKQNSIIEVRQSSTCFYRYTCSADATLDTSVTPNAYNVNVTASSNGSDAIVAGTVFLSIVSAPTSSGSLTVREVDGSPSITANILEISNTFLSDQGGGVARLAFPSFSGGGGLTWTDQSSNGNIAPGQGFNATGTGNKIYTLTGGSSTAQPVAVQGIDSGLYSLVSQGTIFDAAGNSGIGVRRLATHQYAFVQLKPISATDWVIQGSMTGIEFFTPIVGFDADALTFIAAVEAASSALSATDKNRINNVFVGLKANASAKWNKILGLYMFVGSTAATQAINGKSPGTKNLTFGGTSAFDSTGWQPNGTNGAANTAINPSELLANRGTIAVSVSSYGSTAPGFCVGTKNYNSGLEFSVYSTGGGTINHAIRASNSAIYNPSPTKTSGSFIFSRSSNANYTISLDGSIVSTITENVGSGVYTDPIHIGANAWLGAGPSTEFRSALYSMVIIGTDGFTVTEQSELHTLMENYRTTR